MNKFTSWKEYLNDRGSLVEKPEVEKIPDYKGPDPKSPEAGEGQKVKGDKKLDPIPNAAKTSKPASYKSATSNAPAKKPEDKGLSSTGDQKLVYEPNTDIKGGENMPGGKVVSGSWPKGKTETFLNATSKMGMYEFAKYMLEDYNVEDEEDLPTVTAYAAGKHHPHPPEAIRYVVALAKKNKKILEALIHEMKNAGLMKGMLETTMEHPEAHEEMADILGDDEKGPKHAGALARAMDGKVSKFKQEQNDMYESVAPPFGDVGDPIEGNKASDYDAPDDSESPDGPDDENAPDEEPDQDAPDEEPNDMDSEEKETPEKPEKKLKKKFGHHHLIDQMKKFDHMSEYMKQ